jgi:hypothetical protein
MCLYTEFLGPRATRHRLHGDGVIKAARLRICDQEAKVGNRE